MSSIAATYFPMDAEAAPVDPLRALALAARNGESAAFTQLYERTYQLAWGVLLGSPLLGVLAGAAGMVLGATVVRTRSLLVALAWHAAFNVPFFVFLACRAA